ncbi:hypothetical protein SAMN06265338_104237 [Rhodoblastus acidophilus]|uniref:Nitrogen fixation protein n=1 Tax=Rhodoblastus acidophilus TaxID=1074 RepID=A0A212RHT2_RHOAC|nr:nitrogen fixation protein [Rhodoblastus acidophilus]MCW2316988.1 hypothetical protein [Rhodoblastus acidophilus]PPQ38037.1 hypothetical protein CKO16_11400 [Rhodoblastus acidophilus]RAI18448.1 hypothetical protein CH337_14390 [Rhodoblastus acidophilus]SNB71880.1 hypothetical protein SAMN06265338_104237 [Rhodoblastus acidophilus]
MPYDDDLLCPGAPPWTEGAVVFGVVSRVAGRLQVDWLETKTPATPDILALTGDTPPASVLRTAAKCPESCCAHFDGDECQLIGRLVAALAPVASARLPCPIRGECRWFWQEGLAACGRCSQLATQDDHADIALREAARPR